MSREPEQRVRRVIKHLTDDDRAATMTNEHEATTALVGGRNTTGVVGHV